MAVDAELLEILVCPNDRGDVAYVEAEQVIVCSMCRLTKVCRSKNDRSELHASTSTWERHICGFSAPMA